MAYTKNHLGYWTGKKRSKETRLKISLANKKRIYKHIGRKKTAAGYIKIYYPGHHRVQNDKYVLEHIVITESVLGRKLYKNECVHHINGIKNDNRPNNLIVLKRSEHKRIHANKRWNNRSSIITKELLEKEYIIKKRTTIDIAREFNLSISTILSKLREFNLPVRKSNDKEYHKF